MIERHYPADFKSRIGFETVINDIEAMIQTEGGRLLLSSVEFSSNPKEIKDRIDECAEVLWLLRSVEGTEFPTNGFNDFKELIPKLKIVGGYIEPLEMNLIASSIELCENLISFFRDEKRQATYPMLTRLAMEVISCGDIASEIRRLIDKFGVVRDSASAELASIRRELNGKGAQISKRLQQILQRAKEDGYADSDSSLSIRDGRAVIPVAAGHKRKIKGFVFDESASGRTAYIEPIEVIELNNEVRELQNAERYEVVKILTEFANFLRPRLEELLLINNYICTTDFLVAKGKYADRIGGAKPLMSASAELDLEKARHPLLQKVFKAEGRIDELIPLDIRLNANKPLLLISGPNAGGKSVCLKTVGLLQYMYQCGILPSVSENSTMGVFDSVFLDIGDQQSIDNDLSTYSSHLTNMKVMLRESTGRSLILIDEFGGGTEPGVGGAIAESILTQFIERGVVGVITTHYANLKYFAAAHSGIENGAMTFDVQKIKPLYRLEMGVAGNSYAFEIARKIGLPESVLQSAAELVGEDKMSLEKQLRDALRDKRYWENKRQSIRLANKSAEQMAEEYQSELTEIQKERARLIKEAKAEAARIVREAGSLIENTIREIKEAEAEKERTKVVRKKVEKFKAEVEDLEIKDEAIEAKIRQLRQREERRARRTKERSEKKAKEPAVKVAPVVRVVEVGSKVRLDGGETIGEVLSIKGKKATIALGALTSVVELSRLKVSGSTKSSSTKKSFPVIPLTDNDEGKKSVASVTMERSMNFTSQLDIRGMRSMEALDKLQQFIDDAIMVGQRNVRILHGKGTGALKEEVRRYLKSEPMVRTAKDEHVEFGGAGITIVEFHS